jgi:hypothetical protein
MGKSGPGPYDGGKSGTRLALLKLTIDHDLVCFFIFLNDKHAA